MTQEDKQLLLQDLCARLPHGVKVQNTLNGEIIDLETRMYCLPTALATNFKHYLRPLSTMTEEEKKVVCSMNMISDTELNDRLNYQRIYVQNYTIETFDYFNERKLDYRRLIEKGLALEAPERMYDFK